MDTTSLGFQKPKEEEYYDINIFNKNTQLTNDLIEKNSSAIGQKLDKAKSISRSNNRIMQLGFFNYQSNFNVYAKIMRPNLHNGSQLSYADLYIGKYSTSFPVEGKLQTSIDLTQDQYNLRFVITDTGKLYAISPLYNYSEWVLMETNGFTEEIKEVSTMVGNIVWDSNNNTIKAATETNTQIIKNVPAGVTKIENLPMGLYRIWLGSQTFSDYPPLAKKMSHEYGILRVISDNANYKTYSLIGVDANGSHSAEYTGFSATGGGTTAIKWSGVIPYSVNAAGGVTIISQNNYILNGVMHINLTVRKTDSSNFATGVQYSIAGCPNLILTYPKNVSFTGWNLAGNVLIGSGGVGTIFVDTGLYIIPTAACGVLRITGEFLLE